MEYAPSLSVPSTPPPGVPTNVTVTVCVMGAVSVVTRHVVKTVCYLSYHQPQRRVFVRHLPPPTTYSKRSALVAIRAAYFEPVG